MGPALLITVLVLGLALPTLQLTQRYRSWLPTFDYQFESAQPKPKSVYSRKYRPSYRPASVMWSPEPGRSTHPRYQAAAKSMVQIVGLARFIVESLRNHGVAIHVSEKQQAQAVGTIATKKG